MNQQNDYKKGLLLSALGATSWGFSGCLGQYLFMNYSMNSAWLTMVRMLTSGLVLILLSLFRQKKQAFSIFKNKKDFLQLILFSISGLLFCQYSYLSAIEHSNSGTATVLQTLGVVIVPVLLCVTAKKKPEPKEILSILLAFVGVFLIATHGNPSQMALSKAGLFWGLCAALACIVFIGTIGAFLCFLKGISKIGPDKALLIGTLEPVSATIISFFWLHTQFTIADIIGFLCILATVVILTCFNGSAKETSTAY